MVVAPGNGTSQNVRYFARNSHAAFELYDTSAKLFDPDYVHVSVEVEMWEVNVLQANGRWKPTGVGTMTPTWSVSQSATCVNITRIQTVLGVGQFNLTYTLRVGQLLKYTAIYRSYVGGTFEVVMTWNGIASAHLNTPTEKLDITTETHRLVQSFSAGADIDHNVVYEDLTSVYGSVLKDVIFNTYAGGMKADIIMGDYVLAANGVLEIDPLTSTYNVSADSADGRVYNTSGGTYEDTQSEAVGYGASSTVIYVGQTTAFWVDRGFIRFDTSTLSSGTTILSAKVSLGGYADFSTDDFIIRIQKWTGGADITAGDYNDFDGVNYDDGLFSTSAWSLANYNDITISNFNLIIKGGSTDICLRSQEDINISEPMNSEQVQIDDTGDPQPALLIVTYPVPAEDYVDLDDSNVDSSADIGTSSSFAAQKATDGTNDTLTEANTVTTSRDISNGFENSWTNGGGTWTQTNWGFDAATKIVGSYSAVKAASSSAGNLQSPALDTSAASAVHISFRWQDDNCDAASDMYLSFYDSTGNWDNVLDLSALEDDVWLYYSLDTVDAQYLHDDFAIRFTGGALASTENFWVDEAVVTKVTSLFTANMESYLPTGWSENPNPNAWAQDNSFAYGGTYSAGYEYNAGMTTGILVGATKDLSGYTYAYATFWVYDDDSDANELVLKFYDNLGNWDTILDLSTGLGNEDVWHCIYYEITDTQYLHANFAYEFTGGTIANGENVYIDDAQLSGIQTAAANYKLDLEFQFTNVNYTRANEQLCIKTGPYTGTSEAIKVYQWFTGNSTWGLLSTSLTASAWNNITVALTAATFTIRVIGATETSDTAQNTWKIDGNLLHTWETAGSLFNRAASITFTLTKGSARLGEWYRVPTGSFTVTKAGTRLIEVTKTGTKSLTMSVSSTRLLTATRATTQSLSLASSVANLLERGRAATLALTMGLNSARGLIMNKAVNLAVALASSTARFGEYLRASTQAIALSSSAAKFIEITRAASQAIMGTFSAARGLDVGKAAAQSLTMTSAITRLIEVSLDTAQSITFSGAAGRLAEMLRGVTQGVTLTSGVGGLFEWMRAATTTLTFAPNAARLIEVLKAVSQAISTALSSDRLAEFTRIVSQGITWAGSTLAEFITGVTEYFRAATANFTFTNAAVRLVEIGKSASQSIIFSADAVRTFISSVTTSLGLTVTNTAARLLEAGKSASQALTLGNAADVFNEWVRGVSQILSLSPAATRLIEATRAAAQAIPFAANSLRGIIVEVSISLSITITQGGARLYEALRAATQGMTLNNAASYLGDYLRSAAQTLTLTSGSLTEFLAGLQEYLRDAALSLGAASSTMRLGEWLRSATQGLTFADATTKLIEVGKVASQTIAATLSADRLAEFGRVATQGIMMNLYVSHLIEVLKNVTLNISVSLEGISAQIVSALVGLSISITNGAGKLIEVGRSATQGIVTILSGGRLIEALRDATQGFTVANAASVFSEFTRAAAQGITWLSDATRSVIVAAINYTRAAAQTIAISLAAAKGLDVYKAASLALMLSSGALGVFNFVVSRAASVMLNLIVSGDPWLGAVGGGLPYWLIIVVVAGVVFILLARRR